jgi:hypothetical protein
MSQFTRSVAHFNLLNGALLLGVFGLWRLWRFAPRIAFLTTGVVVLSDNGKRGRISTFDVLRRL